MPPGLSGSAPTTPDPFFSIPASGLCTHLGLDRNSPHNPTTMATVPQHPLPPFCALSCSRKWAVGSDHLLLPHRQVEALRLSSSKYTPAPPQQAQPTVKFLYLQYSLHLLPGLKMCTEPQRVGAGMWDCLGVVLGRGAGHWSPWLNHGVPQPPSHAPVWGGHLSTRFRAQVPSI